MSIREFAFFTVHTILVIPNLASGALINVTFDGVNSSSSAGTITETADNVIFNGGTPLTISFEVSGLTIDMFGTADDSFAFTISLAAVQNGGGAALGIGHSAGRWGVNTAGAVASDDASLFDLDDESLSFTLASSSITLGAGTGETGVINFEGFTGFTATGFGSNDRLDLSGGTTADATGIAVNTTTFDPHSTFTVEYNDNGGASNGFRLGSIQAQFNVTAVPEPTSLGFLGLASAGFATYRLRRRREKVS